MNIIIFVASAIIIAFIAFILFRRPKGAKGASDGQHLSQIYVGNLSYNVTEDDLHDRFSDFGKVTAVRIIRDIRTRRSKGFAFVTFANPAQANKALVVHSEDFHGRAMVVRIARQK